MILAEESVEAIARRVTELLTDRPAAGDGLIDAAEVARRLGISRATVYERADELGAIRLGGGSRPRMRFDPARLRQALEHEAEAIDPVPAPPRRPRRSSSRGDLLPIRGGRS